MGRRQSITTVLRYLAPNLITMSSMVFGLVSLWSAAHGKAPLAAWLIIYAVLTDRLDGLVARAEKYATFRARCEQAAGRILAMRRSHAPRPLFGNALHAALATERKTALRRRLAAVLQ